MPASIAGMDGDTDRWLSVVLFAAATDAEIPDQRLALKFASARVDPLKPNEFFLVGFLVETAQIAKWWFKLPRQLSWGHFFGPAL
jgi:hypothetical protein